ncbi:DUF4173 domain-containing protein [Paenibacillus sp. NPDC056579]|uniref:DUF4153 domain-containing protein n=1 Tax=Paenibacillus sp. NPDC056579 TaxID=3345871 RepID=UPI00367706A0
MQTNRSYKQEVTVLGAALLCAVIHHALFYGKTAGISYPLFTFSFYLLFYWAVKDRCKPQWDSGLLLLIPVGLLALTFTLYTNVLFMVLNAMAVPLLVIVHTTWTMRRDSLRWFEPRIVQAVLDQIFLHSLRLLPMPVVILARVVSGKMNTSRSRQLAKVLAGVLLSLPLLLLVGALLASADAMFDRTMSRLPQLLGELELGTLLFRALWIAAVGTALFVYLWGLLYPKPPYVPASPAGATMPGAGSTAERAEAGWEPGSPVPAVSTAVKPVRPLRIDATIAATLLFMLNAVYALFAVVQFSYFFAGGSALLPDGVTYAEYARRGFAELVTVTVINFSLLMITLYGADRTNRFMDRLLRGLLALLVVFTGVMLCSAFMRLSLYELAYGYTITRVLVRAFMIFLAVLFAIALYKLWNDRLQLLQPYAVVAIGAYVLINYIQVDAVVASGNLKRYEATGRIDAAYLGELSYEAAPYLIELHTKYPQAEGAKEALLRMKERADEVRELSWTEFNVSKKKAASLLQAADS